MAAETGEGVDMDICDPTRWLNSGIISGSVTVSLPVSWVMFFLVGFVLFVEQNLLADL